MDDQERLALVLHDMFAVTFDEIAPIVGRSPAAARQLASRARRRARGVDASAGSAGDSIWGSTLFNLMVDNVSLTHVRLYSTY